MRTQLAILLFLVTAWSSTSTSPLAQESFELALSQARAKLVTDLEEVAAFAHKSKAFLERDRTYELILELDTSHAKARKFLKYRFDRRKDAWIQGKYRAPKPGPERAARESVLLREVKVRFHCDTVQRLIEEANLKPAREEQELEVLLKLDPDNPSIRKQRGEVRVESEGAARWLSKATVVARERRREMPALYKELVTEAEISRAEPDETESALGFEWTAKARSGVVTVLGVTTQEEVEDVARRLDAAWEWFPHYLGGAAPRVRGVRVYLIAEERQAQLLIENYPGLAPSLREQMKKAHSAWLGTDTRFGSWKAEREGRLDMSMRHLISLYFGRAYRMGAQQGWIEQSLGLYLTKRLLGTRRSFFLASEEGTVANETDLATLLYEPNHDYYGSARDLLSERKASRIAISLGKDMNSMSASDLVVTYAIAAYLIETKGRGLLAAIFERCGEREPPVRVIEQELGHSLEEFRNVLLRWLKENSEND